MDDLKVKPFSARNRKDATQIDGDFPSSARVALLHLVTLGVKRSYFEDWQSVALEIHRIARLNPLSSISDDQAKSSLQTILQDEDLLAWDKAYDFCERLHSYLAQEVVERSFNDFTLVVPLTEVRQFLADEIQRIFDEENLAYEFRDGIVQRRGRRHTVDRVSRAEVLLTDARLDSARKHFAKAQQYFRDREKPDHENAVKECVCAVEAAAKELFPGARARTLGDSIKWLTGGEPGKLPKGIGQTLAGLYAFRSGGEGVGHGGATGGAVTPALAEYALAVAASQIILLVDLASSEEEEIPF
jgi:hypothetical protein